MSLTFCTLKEWVKQEAGKKSEEWEGVEVDEGGAAEIRGGD